MKLTLGSLENARLAALCKSAVELVGEDGIRNAGQVVVGQNVFLEGLTTVKFESARNIKRDRDSK